MTAAAKKSFFNKAVKAVRQAAHEKHTDMFACVKRHKQQAKIKGKVIKRYRRIITAMAIQYFTAVRQFKLRITLPQPLTASIRPAPSPCFVQSAFPPLRQIIHWIAIKPKYGEARLFCFGINRQSRFYKSGGG